MAREPGDKLGAKLSRLFVQNQVALRRQLAPIEAKISAAGSQLVIDRAGEELAALMGPFWEAALKEGGTDVHPLLRQHGERVASGHNQWESILGNAQMAFSGALGSTISNLVFPVTALINLADTNLPVDPQTGAQAAAAGLVTMDAAIRNAGAFGYVQEAAELWYQLSQAVPGAAPLYDMRNRGLIDDDTVNYWLTRSALPPSLVDAVAQLRIALLSPADAALAVLRGNMTMDDGLAVAAASGLSADDFNILIGNTGEPLALEEMLLLYRWGKMDKATLERGILQSRIRDEWIPYAEMLGIVPPSGAEVIDALVRGQIGRDEALNRWQVSGGDPTWFETAYTSNANPPSPTELAQMAHRGIIPWTGVGPDVLSFQQGIYEGDTKDKWEPALVQNAVYYPPPREISTLVKEGGLSQDEAEKLWTEAGLPPDLQHIYWTAAHYTKTTAIHELAQGEIISLYSDRAIDRTEAKAMLESVNWTPTDADWLLDIADLKVERAALEKAISKVYSLYISWKIGKTTASAALSDLEVPATQAAQLTTLWDLERAANIKVLTASEITDAWYYTLISPQEAQTLLEQLGYTAYDAWLLINIKNKGPIQNFPAPAGT